MPAVVPAQGAPPGAPIKRLMDICVGILPFRKPELSIPWGTEARAAISREAARQSAAGGVKLAELEPSVDPDHKRKRAAAAGFEASRALSVLASFERTDGAARLSFLAQSRADAKPGVTAPIWRNVYMQTTTRGRARDAEAATRTMLEGFFAAFLKPR
jgi:hypothetical protein